MVCGAVVALLLWCWTLDQVVQVQAPACAVVLGKAGLYIRAGSWRSLLASLSGFASYFHCFTSQDMSRR